MSPTDDNRKAADLRRRRLLTRATATAGGLALAGASVPFLAGLAPSERAKAAGAPVEADFDALPPGKFATFEWRGKPVWILRRTPDMLARLEPLRAGLSDPDSRVSSQQPEYARNRTRSIKPEVFVTVSLCTHLGCIPTYLPEPDALEPGWPGGWYCPCHGSKFDLAGRVYRGSPAPTNLVVPPHAFAGEGRVIVGLDQVRA